LHKTVTYISATVLCNFHANFRAGMQPFVA